VSSASASLLRLARRRIHTGWRGVTYVYQDSLPRLPIPALGDTCARYLKMVQPLLTAREFAATRIATAEFAEHGVGEELHATLLQRDAAAPHSSFIDAAWSRMYLRDVRAPLPINVNPFLQLVDDARNADAHRRAASLIASMLRFRAALLAETLLPDVYHVGKLAQSDAFYHALRLLPRAATYYAAYAAQSYPLDMSQYGRLFATSRIPGTVADGGDWLHTADAARHVAVLARGHVYTLTVLAADGAPVLASVLARALLAIERDARDRAPAQASVAALTSESRDAWAALRPELAATNGAQLRAVDDALFVVALDDSAAPSNDNEADASAAGRTFLCGDARSRWFDKSLQLIVCGNGAAAINFEHSWGDGVSVLRLANELHDDAGFVSPDRVAKADDGEWARVDFALSPRLVAGVGAARARFARDVDRLSLEALKVDGFGKRFFKSKNITPDGCVQQAIQLAYRRAYPSTPRPVATYESASTAGFKKGRTETIRPASLASAAMAQTFLRPGASVRERADALRRAAERHRVLSVEASTGKGVDRHLFALRSIAAETPSLPTPSIFADAAYARVNHNILSTSTLVSPAVANGGFGPVVDDGFGVGYATTDDQIGFMISSWKPQAEHRRYLAELRRALQEFKDVLDADDASKPTSTTVTTAAASKH
jgi:carnitine O-palmitoyltransferase 2